MIYLILLLNALWLTSAKHNSPDIVGIHPNPSGMLDGNGNPPREASRGYNQPDQAFPTADQADRSQFNGWPLASPDSNQNGYTRYVRSGPGGASIDGHQPLYGNDQLYTPRPPADPPAPPKYDVRDYSETINQEEYSKVPRIRDPLPANPTPPKPQIISVTPHAACLQGGCTLTIIGHRLYMEDPSIETSIFVGNAECTQIKKIEVPPDCGLGFASESESESGDTSSSTSGTVLVETDAYSNIVHPSLIQLRKDQHQRAARGERVKDA